MRPYRDARQPALTGCEGMITPDQLLRAGPRLIDAARATAARILSAPRHGQMRLVPDQAARELVEAVQALEHADRSGTFLALLALSQRLVADVCTCTPLQVERRLSSATAASTWCLSCHARAARGLPNPARAP